MVARERMMTTSKVKVVVWIDGSECGSAESEVPADLAIYVAQHAIVQIEDPDLDLAYENQTNDPDGLDCPECSRSFGPHYKGPCVH